MSSIYDKKKYPAMHSIFYLLIIDIWLSLIGEKIFLTIFQYAVLAYKQGLESLKFEVLSTLLLNFIIFIIFYCAIINSVF